MEKWSTRSWSKIHRMKKQEPQKSNVPALFSYVKGHDWNCWNAFYCQRKKTNLWGLAKSWPKLSKSEEDEVIIPTLEPGENLKLESAYSVKAPHQRPPRFGVGRFVSTLLKMGLVRPSTMDQIVEKLVDKHYITIQRKWLCQPNLVSEWMRGWV